MLFIASPVTAAGWTRLAVLTARQDGIRLISFSADGKLLASSGYRWVDRATFDSVATIQLWQVGSRESIRLMDDSTRDSSFVAFDWKRDSVVVEAGASEFVWHDMHTGAVQKEFTPRRESSAGLTIFATAMTPDCELVAASVNDGHIELWSVSLGRPIEALSAPIANAFRTLTFSPNSQLLAGSTSNPRNPSVHVWDLMTQARMELKPHSQGVARIVFSPDGKRVLTAGAVSPVKIWNSSTGQLIAEAEPGPVHCVVFSPDGHSFATVIQQQPKGDGPVTSYIDRWEASTGKPMKPRLPHNGPVSSIAYAPDGKSLAVSEWDGEIALYRVPDAHETLERPND